LREAAGDRDGGQAREVEGRRVAREAARGVGVALTRGTRVLARQRGHRGRGREDEVDLAQHLAPRAADLALAPAGDREIGAGDLLARLHALEHERPEVVRMLAHVVAVIRGRVARDDRTLRVEEQRARRQSAPNEASTAAASRTARSTSESRSAKKWSVATRIRRPFTPSSSPET